MEEKNKKDETLNTYKGKQNIIGLLNPWFKRYICYTTIWWYNKEGIYDISNALLWGKISCIKTVNEVTAKSVR